MGTPPLSALLLQCCLLPGPIGERRRAGVVGGAQSHAPASRHHAVQIAANRLSQTQADRQRAAIAVRVPSDLSPAGRAVCADFQEHGSALTSGQAQGGSNLDRVADQQVAGRAWHEVAVEATASSGLREGLRNGRRERLVTVVGRFVLVQPTPSGLTWTQWDISRNPAVGTVLTRQGQSPPITKAYGAVSLYIIAAYAPIIPFESSSVRSEDKVLATPAAVGEPAFSTLLGVPPDVDHPVLCTVGVALNMPIF